MPRALPLSSARPGTWHRRPAREAGRMGRWDRAVAIREKWKPGFKLALKMWHLHQAVRSYSNSCHIKAMISTTSWLSLSIYLWHLAHLNAIFVTG